ncbi:alpha/beta hydrolase family protein [Marinibactrum halimedae]|uniref:Peptidase S9 n=1 Tax=Marinibactrum halimedae TaxID=1444977 RepID=A0AA37WN38_9GAMM|nr:S9 family peptidase [Marinibactrum halimedae]MCD9458857.1 S9 family peptidase [Marinibactrum halimedae]GLS27709.1 peptidase S9 [Marinibactrum halimedae]
MKDFKCVLVALLLSTACYTSIIFAADKNTALTESPHQENSYQENNVDSSVSTANHSEENDPTYTPLPVEAFAHLPDVADIKLSPEGDKIASLIRLNTQEKKGTAVQITDLKTGKSIYPIYAENTKYKLSWILWGNSDTLLASAIFPAVRYGVPTTETRLLSIDVTTGEYEAVLPRRYLRKLDFMPQFQDQIIDLLPNDKDHILMELSVKAESSQVIKVNLKSGKVRVQEKRGRFVNSWTTDQQHNVRARVEREDTEFRVRVRLPDSRDWELFWTFEAFAEDQVWPLGFDLDPKILYVQKYHNNRLAIFKVDVTDPKRELSLVFSDEEYDADGGLLYSKITDKVIGTTFSTKSGFTFWDPKYIALQNGINKALPDYDNIIVDFSGDERRYLLLSKSDLDAGTYYLGDRDSGQLNLVAYRYRALDPKNMAEKLSVSYKARDGVKIKGFLTLPKGSDGKSLPTIIHPHGGPISFSGSGFNYWTQFFANRGYAVLQMDFRGSSGHGFDFMQAGLKNWGKQMQTDVEDGTRWMIEQGYADPERICIVGGSYGGYAALMEAANSSELYQCAISFAGVTDVEYLVKSNRRYTNYEVVKEQIGSNFKELAKYSPVNQANSIDVPVLLVHGTKDRSVRYNHSRKMEKALRKAGKDVTYVEQEDGDHYLSKEEHRVQFFTLMDDFLAKHLGR